MLVYPRGHMSHSVVASHGTLSNPSNNVLTHFWLAAPPMVRSSFGSQSTLAWSDGVSVPCLRSAATDLRRPRRRHGLEDPVVSQCIVLFQP